MSDRTRDTGYEPVGDRIDRMGVTDVYVKESGGRLGVQVHGLQPSKNLSPEQARGLADELRRKADVAEAGNAVIPARSDHHGSPREALSHHFEPRTDPCQDRGADWPCDVAMAFEVVPATESSDG